MCPKQVAFFAAKLGLIHKTQATERFISDSSSIDHHELLQNSSEFHRRRHPPPRLRHQDHLRLLLRVPHTCQRVSVQIEQVGKRLLCLVLTPPNLTSFLPTATA